jgi:hypothetical protein
MLNSFAMMPAGFAAGTQSKPIHRAAHRSRKDAASYAAIFGIFCVRGTGRSDTSVCYRRTSLRDKMRARVDISPQRHSGEISMTLTVAHISPIMSVIAGLLILIMPRLLNFVVAIFLILNGLIGLGLLKWLHM